MSSSLRTHFTLFSRDSTHLLLCQLNPSEFSQNNSHVLYKGHQFLIVTSLLEVPRSNLCQNTRHFYRLIFEFLSVHLGKFHYTTSN
jgi:hypothetical protein